MKSFILSISFLTLLLTGNQQLPGQCNASFSYSINNNTVQFTNNSSSVDILPFYLWDFGDGNTSTSMNPTHSYADSGNFFVCLSVQDDTVFCSDDSCETIVITNPPFNANNSWKQKANLPAQGRQWPIAFSINDKGYVGLGTGPGNYKNDLWEYDHLSNTWTQKADLGVEGRYGAIAFVINNKAYVGLGFGPTFRKDFWEYDPSSNSWAQKANFGGTARTNAVSFAIGSKGYAGTGYDGNPRKDFWEYNPATDSWTQKNNFPGPPRTQAVGFSIGSKGFIGTGFNMLSVAYKDFWQFDPVLNSWTAKANFGGMERENAIAFVLGGYCFIGTGEELSGAPLDDIWKYDTISNSWSQVAGLGPRGRSAAFSIGDFYAFIGGGGSYLNDLWQYSVCPDSIPAITVAGKDTVCKNDSILLNSNGIASTQQWYHNYSSINSAIQGVFYATQSGLYNVKSGCSELSYPVALTFLSNNFNPSICLVTVDSINKKNKIVWEESTDTGITSYNIYKETTNAGEFELIGSIPVSSFSMFTDSLSNPSQMASRYRITGVDTCNNESTLSETHKTIHLTIGLGNPPSVNLIWDGYEGISFGKYFIRRGTNASNLVLIDSIQSSLTSYTDLNPPTGKKYYAIQIVYPQGCDPGKSSDYGFSLSNIENTPEISAVAEIESRHSEILPNPASDVINITSSTPLTKIDIYNTSGEIVYSEKKESFINNSLDLSELPSGIYYVMLSGEEKYFYKKIVLIMD